MARLICTYDSYQGIVPTDATEPRNTAFDLDLLWISDPESTLDELNEVSVVQLAIEHCKEYGEHHIPFVLLMTNSGHEIPVKASDIESKMKVRSLPVVDLNGLTSSP